MLLSHKVQSAAVQVKQLYKVAVILWLQIAKTWHSNYFRFENFVHKKPKGRSSSSKKQTIKRKKKFIRLRSFSYANKVSKNIRNLKKWKQKKWSQRILFNTMGWPRKNKCLDCLKKKANYESHLNMALAFWFIKFTNAFK